MKSFKIKLLIVLSLFISQCTVFQTSLAQSNLNGWKHNTEDLLLSGWKPRNVLTKKGIKPNLKTIEALNKFKKIAVLKPYYKKAKGYTVFPNFGKAVIGIGGARGARGEGEVFKKNEVIGSTTFSQLSIGLQLGGQASIQIIFFKDKET